MIESDDLSGRLNIAVVGVGGGGCNTISRITKSGIKSAKTIAINTDALHLKTVEAHNKILIGKDITRGLGAGGEIDIAKKAGEASRKEIRGAIDGNELVFICAGMGGGTGTGVAPIVAQEAREQGAITVAFVTYPFKLERVRLKKAEEGIKELINEADTVVVIDNNRLLSYVPRLPMNDAFSLADAITGRAVKGISETIVFPSLINIDFADIKTIMGGGGLSFISLGEASGVGREETIVKNTLEHPLLDVSYEGAKGALIHLEGGIGLTLGEAVKIWEKLTEQFDVEAQIKMGARVLPDLGESVRVTAVITGIASSNIFGRKETGQVEEQTQEELLI